MIALAASIFLVIAANPRGGAEGAAEAPPRKAEPTVATAENNTGAGDAAPTVVTSDQLDIDNVKNIAVFSHNVHVTSNSGEMWADKMVAYFNPDDHQIEKLVSTGKRVVVKTENKISRSRKAVYTASDGRIVLTGNPSIVHGVNTYGAERITIFKDSDRTIFEPRARLILYSDYDAGDMADTL